jgi:hypothetical protein
MRRLVSLAAVGALLGLTGTGSANPWDLRCASMPAEQRAPQAVHSAAQRFFPWVGVRAADAQHDGPVYLLALSSQTRISRDGDDRDAGDYYLHRALVAIAPSYAGPVTIVGGRLGRPAARSALGFSTNGANRCTVANPFVTCGDRPLRYAPRFRIAPRPGWRIVETQLRIGRTGCFRLTATGPQLNAHIPLAVPGPDWGTPGVSPRAGAREKLFKAAQGFLGTGISIGKDVPSSPHRGRAARRPRLSPRAAPCRRGAARFFVWGKWDRDLREQIPIPRQDP